MATGRLANAGTSAGTTSANINPQDLLNKGTQAATAVINPPAQQAKISPLLAGVVAGALGYAFTKKPMTAALIGGAGLLGVDYMNDKEINLK